MVFRVIGPIFGWRRTDGDVTRDGCEFIRCGNGFHITEIDHEGNDVINTRNTVPMLNVLFWSAPSYWATLEARSELYSGVQPS